MLTLSQTLLFASNPSSKGTFSRCLAVSCLCAHTHFICALGIRRWPRTHGETSRIDPLETEGLQAKWLGWNPDMTEMISVFFLIDLLFWVKKRKKKKGENAALETSALLCNSSLWRSRQTPNQSIMNSMYANNTS